MLIEAAKGGHTNVVQMLIDYPNSLSWEAAQLWIPTQSLRRTGAADCL